MHSALSDKTSEDVELFFVTDSFKRKKIQECNV